MDNVEFEKKLDEHLKASISLLGKIKAMNILSKYVDIELRVPTVKKAYKLLGFEAKIGMEEGIRRTAEYYRSLLKSG